MDTNPTTPVETPMTPQPLAEAQPVTPPQQVRSDVPVGIPTVSSGPPRSNAFPPQIIIIGVAAVILIILGVVGLTAFKPQNIVVAPTPTPSVPVATPTPARTLSPLATQSAFLLFEQSVASLSAGVAAYNVQDQSLTPPVLVLPLGFSQ